MRVASWPAGAAGAGPKTIDKNTPYEKLRSIKFTQPESEASAGSSSLESTVGPAVAKLLKGGKGLMKASAPGMAAAGIAHVASNASRKSFLTIATDKAIHSLTNQTANSVGLKMSNKGHNEIGRALEAAGIAVLGQPQTEPAIDAPAATAPQPAGAAKPSAPSALSERLRELAGLSQGRHPVRRRVRGRQGQAARRALIGADRRRNRQAPVDTQLLSRDFGVNHN